MESLLAHLLTWIGAHPTWAGLVIFFIALSESLIVVGIIVPGVVVMFGVGALIATGHLPFGTTLAWSVAGAFAGDVLSYWIGRHFKQRLRVVWPFRQHPRMLAGGVAFFHRHGGKGVLLGRFVGPLRAIVPAVAGMLEMSPLRFTLANLASALLWAPLYLLPGMAFGASLSLASEVALRLVLFLLLTLGGLWLTIWLLGHSYRWAAPRAGMTIYRLLDWSRRHPRLGRLPDALLDPTHPDIRALAALALLLLGAGASFAWISESTHEYALLGNLDLWVFHGLQALRTPQADALMVWVTRLGSATIITSVAVAGLSWLLWCRRGKAAAYWLAAIVVPAILFIALKHGFAIPRPRLVSGYAQGYAYPSGHTVMATALYGFLAVMLARHAAARWRVLIYTLAGTVIAAVGFSRLYLGVHWLSDVLGGLSLGLAWVALIGIAYRRHHPIERDDADARTALTRPPIVGLASGLTLVTLLTLGIGMAVYSALRYDSALRAYAPPVPPAVVENMHTWWTGGWAHLPAYREDLRGRHRHPLDLQWAAPRAAIRDTLLAQGWHPAPALTATRLLQWFRAHPAPDALPVLPQVHDGRDEALRLVKAGPDCLLTLRLWSTNRQLRGVSQTASPQGRADVNQAQATPPTRPDPRLTPLFIGNVSCLHVTRLLGLSVLRTASNFTVPLQRLETDLAQRSTDKAQHLAYRLRRRPGETNGVPRTGPPAMSPDLSPDLSPGTLLIRGPLSP